MSEILENEILEIKSNQTGVSNLDKKRIKRAKNIKKMTKNQNSKPKKNASQKSMKKSSHTYKSNF